MAYTHDIINKAFQLFCYGLSYEKIVEEMKKTRKKSFKLSVKTVKEWAQKYAWETRRAEVQRLAGEKQRENIADSLNNSIRQLNDTVLFLQEILPYGKIPTMSAAASAMGKLIQLRTKLQGVTGSSKMSNAQIINTLLNVMEEDEELGEILKRKEDWILERFTQMAEE